MPRDQLKIGILLNYINLGIGNLIPLFYIPVMLRLLGQEEYGLYHLSSSAVSYLGLITMGLGGAITRYLIKAKIEEGGDAEAKMLGLFLLIFRGIALISFLAGILLDYNLDIWYSKSLSDNELQKMQLLVFIMVCNSAFSISVTPFMSIVAAHEQFVFQQIMSILATSILPILNLVALFLGYASVGLAIISLIMAMLIRGCYYLFVRKRLQIMPQYKYLPVSCIKEILLFSFWIFVADVVSKLYVATDIMLIGAIPTLAVKGVAIYNIGIMLDRMISGISAGISGLLSPRINKMVFSGSNNTELTTYAIRIGRLQCYIVVLVVTCFFLFGKPLIHFYLGDDYLGAYWITIFVCVPKIIVLAQTVCLSIIVAQNKHRFRSIAYLLVAIGNALFTYLILPFGGIQGAAFMSGLSFFIGHGLIMNWFYWKKSGLEIPRFWVEISKVFWIPFLTAMVAYGCSHLINLYDIWNLLVCIILFIILVFCLQWVITLNEYEKGLLLAPLRKIKRK